MSVSTSDMIKKRGMDLIKQARRGFVTASEMISKFSGYLDALEETDYITKEDHSMLMGLFVADIL